MIVTLAINTLTLKRIFRKTKTFIKKLEYHFLGHGVKVGPGPQDPGPRDPGPRDPGPEARDPLKV